MFNGYRVYEDINMVVADGFDDVPRDWKERLFTLPWKPFKTTRRVVKYKPSDQVLVADSTHSIIAHPSVVYQLNHQIGIRNPAGVVNLGCMV